MGPGAVPLGAVIFPAAVVVPVLLAGCDGVNDRSRGAANPADWQRRSHLQDTLAADSAVPAGQRHAATRRGGTRTVRLHHEVARQELQIESSAVRHDAGARSRGPATVCLLERVNASSLTWPGSTGASEAGRTIGGRRSRYSGLTGQRRADDRALALAGSRP